MLRLLDQAGDVGIGQSGGDDAGARLAAAGYQFIGRDRDGNAIVRVESAARQFGGDFADCGLDYLRWPCHACLHVLNTGATRSTIDRPAAPAEGRTLMSPAPLSPSCRWRRGRGR